MRDEKEERKKQARSNTCTCTIVSDVHVHVYVASTPQAMLEVTSVADRFGFVALKQALGDQFSQNHISLDTVLLLLVHSDMYHLPQLHKGCLAFIEDKSHTTDVLNHDSLLDLPEESLIGIISRDTFVAPEIEIFEAVKRWKQRNDKGVKEMAKVLKCVRLSEFSSAKQVFEDVEPTGLLDEKSILAAARVLCKPSVTEMQPRGRKGTCTCVRVHTCMCVSVCGIICTCT